MVRTRLILAASVAALTFGSVPASAQQAQQEPPVRRLDRLDRAVRELNLIIRQGASTGRPVTVAPDTLPAELDALRRRLDDLEATQRTQTSTIESLTGDLNSARRTATEAQAQVRDLQDRLSATERAAAQAAMASPPLPEDEFIDDTAADAPAANDAEGGSQAAFARARQKLLEGDYAAASTGFQAYADRYPDDDQAPEARYWLGETRYIREDYAGAAQAYVAALRGWPKSSWGPDATVKLANSLAAVKRNEAACQALGEFDRRYAKASAAVKARAATARTRAQCA